MMQVECYRDRDGAPRAGVEPGNEMLKSFLEEDVQESVATCRAVLSALQEIGGERSEWRQTGNAHVLTILSDRVTIDPLFLEDNLPYEVSRAELESVMKRWLALISD
ncbi:MAG: YacL family protein [Syntrophobacteraceae bacterium]